MSGPLVNGLPPGYTAAVGVDGSISLFPPVSTPGVMSIVHSALVDAGAQIPTAIAAPLTVASLPVAMQAGFDVAASVATGNYVGAATTGIPLLITGVMALYVSLSQPRKPNNEQLNAWLSTLTHDELVGLCKRDSGAISSAANAAAVQHQTGVSTATGINAG